MKNRTAIGIVCIILAVAVTFVVSPLVNNISDKKTEVVRFVADVSHGTEIKDTDIEVVKISNSALPEKVIKDKKSVVGKFATADIFKGDFATESKVTDNANTANDVMASLKGDKVAMSITINSFAGGLSGKLENGDIVSIYVTDKDNHTEVPASLKYVWAVLVQSEIQEVQPASVLTCIAVKSQDMNAEIFSVLLRKTNSPNGQGRDWMKFRKNEPKRERKGMHDE